MRYKVHRFEIRMETNLNELENFLNNLQGEVVSIIPNNANVSLFQILWAFKKNKLSANSRKKD